MRSGMKFSTHGIMSLLKIFRFWNISVLGFLLEAINLYFSANISNSSPNQFKQKENVARVTYKA
jgi:hypothetical protein